MTNISRRNFIKGAGLLLGTPVFANFTSLNLFGGKILDLNTIGFQVWTIRKKLIENFGGTLLEMAGMGYSQVEMCSPLGYTPSGFGPLNKMSGTEMRKIIEDAGLICRSSHFTMSELREHLDNRIEWSGQMGITQMINSSFGLPEDASIDDYRRAANELNIIGEKTRAAGIQTGYHNHNMEFKKEGDKLIYNALMEEFDPELVKMQFQVAVVRLGYRASDFFRKYPGRFISAHLSDWSPEKKTTVPIGSGIVNWKDFFEAAKIGGVKNFFVEMAPEFFQPSMEYLTSLH